MITKTIVVNGMSCNHCVMRVTRALEQLEGVKEVKVSLNPNHAVVTFDETLLTYEQLAKAIEEAGYQAAGYL